MSLLDDILRMVGTSRTRIRWRWDRFRDGWKKGARSAENRSRAIRYEHKVCPVCAHPADKNEAKCPSCGAALGSRASNRARRVFGSLLPEGLPIYTMVIVLVCGALYFANVHSSGETGHVFRGPNARQSILSGALVPEWAFLDGQWWRLLTSTFLHGGLLHLAFNMISLVQLGTVFEERWGRQRFLAVFLLTGVAGMLFSAWLHVRSGSPAYIVGASGAVFGLIGAGIGHLIRRGTRGTKELRDRMIAWAIFGLVLSFQPHVDWRAHVGGLLAGIPLGVLVADKDTARRWARTWMLVVLELALLAVVVLAFVANHQWVAQWK